MERRKFLRNLAIGIPAAIYLPRLLTSCNDLTQIDTDKVIYIIGGGVSGLAAAKYFKDRGVNVTVIESQEKPGGRVRTNRSLGIPFEEGANWLHGPNGNPLTTIANDSGATTYEEDESLGVFDNTGSPYTESFLESEIASFNDAVDTVRSSGNQFSSFEEIFNALYPGQLNNRLWKYMLSVYLESDTGADISDLASSNWDDDDGFAGGDFIINNGYDKIPNFLAQGIDIRLNERVTAIDYSGSQISITTNQMSHTCDFVIITTPLGVLKNNGINFTPSLPTSKQQAIQDLKMGTMNKFICLWDTAFWDTNLQYIGYTPEQKGKFNIFHNVGKYHPVNALMTFCTGDYSVTTESMSDAQVITEIMDHLKSIYGPGIPDPTGFLRSKWNTNINAYGCYSFTAKGATSSQFDVLAQQVSNKLFFAGEHTSKDYRGTVHGAYISGIREAEKIVDLL